MIFDITSYGAGLGLIIVSWVCGLCVSYIFSTNSILSNLFKR